jgi:hypothetical protein
MEPVGVETTADGYDLLHHCTKCGVTKRNKVADNDSREALANILKNQ